MSAWLESAMGGILGLVLVGGVFWRIFWRMPERRGDGGLTRHDAAHYTSGDNGDGHHSE